MSVYAACITHQNLVCSSYLFWRPERSLFFDESPYENLCAKTIVVKVRLLLRVTFALVLKNCRTSESTKSRYEHHTSSDIKSPKIESVTGKFATILWLVVFG